MARLQIEFRGASTVVSLKHGETTVGRSNRCTIHLPDPTLAEVHFRIERRARGYRLKDDGSGSGTRVDGKPVYATTLAHGDTIQAGAVRCTFLEESGKARPAAAAPAPPREAVSAPREEAPRAPRAPRPDRTGLFVGLALAVLAIAAGVWFWRTAANEEEATRLYKEAVARIALAREEPTRAMELLGEAADQLEEVIGNHPGARVAATAEISLAEARRIRTTIDALHDVGRALGETPSTAAVDEAWRRLASLRDTSHPAIEAAAMEVDATIRAARVARLDAQFDAAAAEAARLADERRFADALAVWEDLPVADFVYRRRADEARTALATRIAAEYRGVLRLAARNTDIDARIGLLEASRETFRGTRHAEDLEIRISALRARKERAALVRQREKEREAATPATPEQPGPPVPSGPFEEPAAVTALVGERRFGEAAALLHSISRHPDARTRIDELGAVAAAMADLVAAVRADPAAFDNVLLPGGGRADAAGADAQALVVRDDGAERRIPWSGLDIRAFPRLFRQADLLRPPRLGVALFYAEEGEADEARELLVDCFEEGVDLPLLTRALARRRGIDPPADGFVVFRGDLVTPSERERALLVDRIEKLVRDARIATDRRRAEIWDELERLGDPAAEMLAAALRARRAEVAEALASSKAFRPSTWAARFGAELRRCREHALAFILDANAYPYPNKTAEAQAEAEERVDAVRELYQQPYPLLLDGAGGAGELDAELQALDARLARVDPLGEPLYGTTVDAIVARLEIANIAIDDGDRKRIAYNRSVMEYNRELEKTTVDDEERANVEAVNRYRWMMGLRCVKIDERLVRAARKHSIEMQQLGYFDHTSPTAHLRDPTMRARREGYGGGVAENIARGASTGVQAFWQWFKSSGHHRNMLRPGHTELGCGAANHHWWTQKFGSATGRSLDPPRVPPDPDPPGQSGNGLPAPGDPSAG